MVLSQPAHSQFLVAVAGQYIIFCQNLVHEFIKVFFLKENKNVLYLYAGRFTFRSPNIAEGCLMFVCLLQNCGP